MLEELSNLINDGLITKSDKYVLMKRLDDPRYRIKQAYENFRWDSLKGKYEILMLPTDSEAVDKAEYNLDRVLEIGLLKSEEASKLNEAYKIEGELYVPGADGDGQKPPINDFTIKTKDSTVNLGGYELSETVRANSFYWRYDPHFSQKVSSIRLSGKDEMIITLKQVFSGNKLTNKKLYRYNPDNEENEPIPIDYNLGLVTFIQLLREYHDKLLVEGEPKVEERKKRISQPFDGMFV